MFIVYYGLPLLLIKAGIDITRVDKVAGLSEAFRGGSAETGDDLSLSKTKLDRIGNFTRRSVVNGGGPHQLAGTKYAANTENPPAF